MNDFTGLARVGRLVEVIRIVKSKRLFGTRMNTCKYCDEESSKKTPAAPEAEAEVLVWSRLAQAEGQSDCEKSVTLIGAWATHILSRAYIHPRVLIEFAFLIQRKFCC